MQLKNYLLLLLFLVISFEGSSQELSNADLNILKEKITSYNEILNMILEGGNELDEIIDNQFDPSNLSRAFIDDDAKIFDFLFNDGSEKIVKARKFLIDLKLRYIKEDISKVNFSGIEIEKIKPGLPNTLYAEVNYTAEIYYRTSGESKILERKASLKAEKIENNWFWYFTTILDNEDSSETNTVTEREDQNNAFLNVNDELMVSPGDNLNVSWSNGENLLSGVFYIKYGEKIYVESNINKKQSNLSVTIPFSIAPGEYQISIIGENINRQLYIIDPIPLTIISRKMVKILNPVHEEAIKRGKEYTIQLEDKYNFNIVLKLKNEGQFIKEIWRGKGQKEIKWNVPADLKIGKDYNFIIEEEDSKRYIVSPSFKIKRKIPLWIKITPIACLTGFAIYKFLSDNSSSEENNLPDPIFPE